MKRVYVGTLCVTDTLYAHVEICGVFAKKRRRERRQGRGRRGPRRRPLRRTARGRERGREPLALRKNASALSEGERQREGERQTARESECHKGCVC